MRIFIGSDHAGFEAKERIIAYLKTLSHEVTDCGAYEFNLDDDYPDFIKPVAVAIMNDKDARGIIIGKSGQGEAMCANRFKGVRAAVWYGGGHEPLHLSREHNDANVLSIGAGIVPETEMLTGVEVWINTKFPGEERHLRRIAKLDI
ncbi:MAG: RpiB/LacA/LacB family sugar-phosphate isomerase [Candidatus Zambryskibacteria bacterium]|nr:RpiB/LacA/LacB family sugar-phosphate isomerase [Candidatus Zambryskibacteria bacterium]